MSDYAAQLVKVIGSAPADLVAYYEVGHRPVYPRSQINCLSFESARDYSQKMHRIPIVDRLGLWVLDDANDSNPFGYISKGSCAGMIIHFSHDPEPRIAFASLRQFLSAMRDAGERGQDIDEIAREPVSTPLDQAIRELALEESDDATFLLCAYLPITSWLEQETKQCLLSHSDFFVREAFAAFLAKRPSATDLMIAEQLANDKHPQVARAGKTAIDAAKRTRPTS